LAVDFVTWVRSVAFVEDLTVDVDGSVPLNSSVVDTGWMGWLLSEDVVIGFVVDVVFVVVVCLVLTTTVDGLVGACIGVVRTISWYRFLHRCCPDNILVRHLIWVLPCFCCPYNLLVLNIVLVLLLCLRRPNNVLVLKPSTEHPLSCGCASRAA